MQDYAHKDKVLGGFEGVWHNWKAGDTNGGRETERTQSVGPDRMRICTTDGFRLLDSGNEKTSLEKFISSRSSIVGHHLV